MSDPTLPLLAVAASSALGGLIGGIIAALSTADYLARRPRQPIELQQHIILEGQPLSVPIRATIQQPAPVVVEVQAVANDKRDIAFRMLSEYAARGAVIETRLLGRVLGCSPSTADSYIKAWEATQKTGEANVSLTLPANAR